MIVSHGMWRSYVLWSSARLVLSGRVTGRIGVKTLAGGIREFKRQGFPG